MVSVLWYDRKTATGRVVKDLKFQTLLNSCLNDPVVTAALKEAQDKEKYNLSSWGFRFDMDIVVEFMFNDRPFNVYVTILAYDDEDAVPQARILGDDWKKLELIYSMIQKGVFGDT